jgi:hypothetical protein
LSDHPVLIPTSFGPVEGTVTEPEGIRRAAIVLTQANGRAGRWGTNGVWTRTARELSQCGVVVLRADYARGPDDGAAAGRRVWGQTDAEWERDLAVRHEVAEWFRERAGCTDLMMAGICRGALVAIHVAALNSAISRLFLIAPPVLDTRARRRWLLGRRRRPPRMRISSGVAAPLIQVVERIPVTMLCVERDAAFLDHALRSACHPFALDLIPSPRLNRMESPEVQAATLEHTVRWASGPLAERAIAP